MYLTHKVVINSSLLIRVHSDMTLGDPAEQNENSSLIVDSAHFRSSLAASREHGGAFAKICVRGREM